jgi:hypothetical protein
MSSVLGFFLQGCVLSSSEKPTPEAQYAFTQGPTGQLVQADVDALDSFTPTQTFDHSLASKSEQAVLGGEPVPGCFGSCNSTSCSCVGDFDCCVAGCSICIILAN